MSRRGLHQSDAMAFSTSPTNIQHLTVDDKRHRRTIAAADLTSPTMPTTYRNFDIILASQEDSPFQKNKRKKRSDKMAGPRKAAQRHPLQTLGSSRADDQRKRCSNVQAGPSCGRNPLLPCPGGVRMHEALLRLLCKPWVSDLAWIWGVMSGEEAALQTSRPYDPVYSDFL